MERDWQPKQPRVKKQKADDAYKCFAVFKVDLSSGRNQGRDDLWIDHKVEHREISPVRGEKWSHRENLASTLKSAIWLNATASPATDRDQPRALSRWCNGVSLVRALA